MSKEDKLFKEWAEQLRGEIEESEQAAFDAWIALPVARTVFRGHLAEEKLYTELNKINSERQELQQKEADLQEWFEEEKPKNEKLLAERDALRKQLEEQGSGNPPPAKGSPVSLSPEDLARIKATEQKLETLDKLLPAVLGDVAAAVKDAAENKFNFDPREMIKLSVQKGAQPWQAYLYLTAEQRQKREEAAREAERQKWIEEGKRSVTTNSPDHLQPSGSSVVDYIHEMNKKAGAAGTNVSPSNESAGRVGAALQALQEVDINQLS